MQHGLVGFVGEANLAELDPTFYRRQELTACRVAELFALSQHFHGAVQPGHGFSQLCADVDHLEDRRDHEREKADVLKVAARGVESMPAGMAGHLIGQHLVPAKKHHQPADSAEHSGR